ncbi:hypothetical protein BN12_1680008 [Nostocoides japonicum T1-X7]|uniref:Uncharacterized protein n=1 Tax=Nostocoides japonicum T1-X7 TaxID=1194083 RepID=A0A077LWG7_9MICO|nr:hypothetical protein [Tetrasphaera japonica]CCH77142.1 hypothetical protein BN12_1680008 [Tetrasphaera japonica T1-X7]
MNSADLKGTLTGLWERAHASAPTGSWPTVTRLAGPDVPRHMTAWAVGRWSDEPDDDRPRQIIVTPSLKPDAPASVRRRLLARVIADGSGECPLCSAVAGLDREPPAPGEPGIAAWRTMPLHITLTHAVGCPATFGDEDRRHFEMQGDQS